MIIFISYATPDSNKFTIPHIARELEKYPEIEEALFWEQDTKDDIVDYMSINIPRSDIFILFCSEKSLKSEIVALEWKAALQLRKRIIPIFEDIDHVPPILRSMLGVIFNESDIERTIQSIYETIGRKLGQPLEYEDIMTPSQITQNIKNIREELQNKLNQTNILRDLEMRILAYPFLPRDELFGRTQFEDLKRSLERNVSRGLMIDSISRAVIFNRLGVDQNGFYSISNRECVGSIIIKKNGFLIYNLHFNKDNANQRDLLQTYYMAAYFLGFLDLLLFFFEEIEYEGDVRLIFDVHNIHEWSYSPYPEWLPYDDKQFNNAEFTPIEKNFPVKFLEEVENRYTIVQDIFSEMILGYGETAGYKIPDDFKSQY